MTAFLTAESGRLAPKTAQRLATALRSLLRFWHVEGLISGPLDRAVPKVATGGRGFRGAWNRCRCRPCCHRVTARAPLGAGTWRC